jgi:peptidoglycan/LPS O-acetylase OafA/YrhL
MESEDGRTVAKVPRYLAVDGLRAWMAWLVVFSHIVQQAGAATTGPAWQAAFEIGNIAVQTFIIISGFVIAHLLTERRQRYPAYIASRFMRLFPAYAVCIALTAACYSAAARLAAPSWFLPTHGVLYSSEIKHLGLHLIAHATMFHGAIPNSVLWGSQYVFLPPAWSISLEWQFYLLAPFLIAALRRSSGAFLLTASIVALTPVYHHALGDLWGQPSVVIGAGHYFLIGIATRLWAPSLAGQVRFPAAVSLGLAAMFMWLKSPALALWIGVYTFMLRAPEDDRGLAGHYVAVAKLLLESKWVQLLAERSYSTYLLHWSVLMVIGTVASRAGLTAGRELVAVMLLAVPLTLVGQELLYRCIEVPGRNLGRQLSRRLESPPATQTLSRQTERSAVSR